MRKASTAHKLSLAPLLARTAAQVVNSSRSNVGNLKTCQESILLVDINSGFLTSRAIASAIEAAFANTIGVLLTPVARNAARVALASTFYKKDRLD